MNTLANLAKRLKQDLDELRLQFTLGRMEGRDSFIEQKEKVEQSIASVRRGLSEIEDAADDAISKSKTNFVHRAGAFAVKMEKIAGLRSKTYINKIISLCN